MKTRPLTSFSKIRDALARKVRQLREERRLSQAALAEKLGLSQTRLSDIERGLSSFTAEEFIAILALFNVGVADFVPTAETEDELQNALVRLGAKHLLEIPDVVLSERLQAPNDVIREVLISAKHPRLFTGLAPVLVAQIDAINLHRVNAELAQVGLQRRLGWVVENTVEAVSRGRARVPRQWSARYRGAEVILGNFLGLAVSELSNLPEDPAHGVDFLDRTIRSTRTLEGVLQNASAIAKRWRIATSLQVDDFATALKAAHV